MGAGFGFPPTCVSWMTAPPWAQMTPRPPPASRPRTGNGFSGGWLATGSPQTRSSPHPCPRSRPRVLHTVPPPHVGEAARRNLVRCVSASPFACELGTFCVSRIFLYSNFKKICSFILCCPLLLTYQRSASALCLLCHLRACVCLPQGKEVELDNI